MCQLRSLKRLELFLSTVFSTHNRQRHHRIERAFAVIICMALFFWAVPDLWAERRTVPWHGPEHAACGDVSRDWFGTIMLWVRAGFPGSHKHGNVATARRRQAQAAVAGLRCGSTPPYDKWLELAMGLSAPCTRLLAWIPHRAKGLTSAFLSLPGLQ